MSADSVYSQRVEKSKFNVGTRPKYTKAAKFPNNTELKGVSHTHSVSVFDQSIFQYLE